MGRDPNRQLATCDRCGFTCYKDELSPYKRVQQPVTDTLGIGDYTTYDERSGDGGICPDCVDEPSYGED